MPWGHLKNLQNFATYFILQRTSRSPLRISFSRSLLFTRSLLFDRDFYFDVSKVVHISTSSLTEYQVLEFPQLSRLFIEKFDARRAISDLQFPLSSARYGPEPLVLFKKKVTVTKSNQCAKKDLLQLNNTPRTSSETQSCNPPPPLHVTTGQKLQVIRSGNVSHDSLGNKMDPCSLDELPFT